jgi:hypothetical protein
MVLKSDIVASCEGSCGDYYTLGDAYHGKSAGPVKHCPVQLAMSSCK